MATASRITLDLIEHAYDWAEHAVEASDHAAGGLLERFTVICDTDSSGAATFSEMDDNDTSDDLTAGDAIRVQLENCGDSTSKFSLEVGSINTLNYVPLSLTGTVTFSIAASAESGTASIAEYTGSFGLDYTKSGDDTTLSLTNIEASRVIGDMTDRLESGRLQESIAGLDYTVEFAGRLESDELDGAFDFETGTAFADSLGSFPTVGELTLTATNSNARVTPSSSADLDEHADYQVDSGGTGQYSEAVSVPWNDWISGSLFRWYPLIRGLAIVPRNPGTSDRLRAVFRTYAPQGERVSTTYEWTVNGSQVGHTMDYLPSGNTSKGDAVEVRVTATGGEDSLTRQTSVTIRNIPPDVQAMLSPELPDTRDDIALSYRVGDIDGDEVETSIQWSINGNVVSGLETATLPSDRHRKNDVIRVLISANDGETETSSEVELTIEDAIPDIGVSGVPGSVAHGDRAQFDATVSDADGDDLGMFRFGLDYGPVGMTVDPVSGHVEWDAGVPMFEREMDIGWQIGSASGGAETVSGVIRVVDPDRQYPFMVSGINGTRDDGIRIADIDGDGKDEMLVVKRLGHVYTLEWDGQILRESWAHPFAINRHSGTDAVTSGDVDGDGRHEIFLLGNHYHVGDDSLIRLDGVDRRIAASATVPPMIGSGNAIEFADLDNDGSFELVHMADADPHYQTSIVVLSADDLTVLWKSPPDYLGGYVKVGNVDRDPALEIVVSGGHVFDGATYQRQWSHESAYSAANVFNSSTLRGLFVSDMDGDGIDEIIGRLNHDNGDAGVEVYSVDSGAVLGNAGPIPRSLFDSRTAIPLVADFDDEGATEILGISFPDFKVSAYRYAEQSDEFQEVFSQESNSMFHAPVGVGDLDGDGATEIVLGWKPKDRFGYPTGVGRFILAGFNQEFELESTGSNVRTFDGGFVGGLPVMDQNMSQRGLLFALWGGSYVHSDGPRAVFLSPTSGEFTIGPRVDVGKPFDSLGGGRSNLSGVSISDYDRDGVHELLMSMASVDQPYVAFDPFREVAEWSSDDLSGAFVAAVDLNGDGFEDFLTRSTGYDIVNDDIIWKHEPPHPDASLVHASGGDLDGDGVAEIVGIEGQYRNVVVVYSRTGNQDDFSRSVLSNIVTDNSDSVADLLVSDTDADGKAEIVLLTSSLSSVRRFGSNLELLNAFTIELDYVHDRPDRLFIVPGSGGKQQLLVSFSHNSLAQTSRIVAFDPETGHEIWEVGAVVRARVTKQRSLLRRVRRTTIGRWHERSDVRDSLTSIRIACR